MLRSSHLQSAVLALCRSRVRAYALPPPAAVDLPVVDGERSAQCASALLGVVWGHARVRCPDAFGVLLQATRPQGQHGVVVREALSWTGTESAPPPLPPAVLYTG